MSFAYREMFAPGVLGVMFGICGALIFLYAFIGPYGTKQAFSFSQRLLFCILWGVVGVPIWYTVGTLVLYVLRFRSRTQIAFSIVLYVLFNCRGLRAAPFRDPRPVVRLRCPARRLYRWEPPWRRCLGGVHYDSPILHHMPAGEPQ